MLALRSEPVTTVRAQRAPSALALVLRAECAIAWRRRGEALGTLVFFSVVASMLPLALEATPALLAQVGCAMVWMATLLAVVLAATRLFVAEADDAVLEQLLLAAQPLTLIVLTRVACHWLLYCAPLLVLGPAIALAYGVGGEHLAALLASLALGSPTLVLLAALSAALTLRLSAASALLATLALPLFVPVLIFAGACCRGVQVAANLSLLGAALCAALAVTPLATVAALRLGIE